MELASNGSRVKLFQASNLKGKSVPTMRAPDRWESTRFQAVCVA